MKETHFAKVAKKSHVNVERFYFKYLPLSYLWPKYLGRFCCVFDWYNILIPIITRLFSMIIVNEYFVHRAASLTCGRYEFPEVLLGAMMHIQNIFWPLWIFANVYWTHCPEVLFIMDVSKITSTRRHKYHKTIFNIHNQGCRLQDIIRTLWVLDWIETENLNIKALIW